MRARGSFEKLAIFKTAHIFLQWTSQQLFFKSGYFQIIHTHVAEAGPERCCCPLPTSILQLVAARPQGEYTVFAADMFSTVKTDNPRILWRRLFNLCCEKSRAVFFKKSAPFSVYKRPVFSVEKCRTVCLFRTLQYLVFASSLEASSSSSLLSWLFKNSAVYLLAKLVYLLASCCASCVGC